MKPHHHMPIIDLTMEDNDTPSSSSVLPHSTSPAIKIEPENEQTQEHQEIASIEVDPFQAFPTMDKVDEPMSPVEDLTEFENNLAEMLNEFEANSRAERGSSSDIEYDNTLQEVKQKRADIAHKESLGEPVDEDHVRLKVLEGVLYQAENRKKKERDHEIRQAEENAMFFSGSGSDEEEVLIAQAPTRNEALGIPNSDSLSSDDNLDNGCTPGNTNKGRTTSQRSRGKDCTRKTSATKSKLRIQKRTPIARRGGGRNKSGNTGLGGLNMASLIRNPIVEDAQRNQGQQAQPTFRGETTKKDALTALIASIPEEHQDTTYGMKTKLDKACKVFRWKGPGSMKPDPTNGRFRLKGMGSSLKHFQLFGASWGVEREIGSTAPFGGILADTMGYGKTVQMIAIMVENQPKRGAKNKTTLIVVPSSITTQWLEELALHCSDGTMESVYILKSGSRPAATDVCRELKKYSVVITTYHEVMRSYPKCEPPIHLVTEKAKDLWWNAYFQEHKGPLLSMPFYRVVLDEAQLIKNHESRTSKACRLLTAKYKWVLTGTPLSNCMEEFYPYFDFLGVEGAGSYKQFQANFCKRNDTTMQRMDAILKKVMMRRTGADRLFGMPLTNLPALDYQTTRLSFNPVERAIYSIVRQRFINRINDWSNSGKINQLSRNIFVMLTRLRQMCAHVLMVTSTIRNLLEAEDIEKLWRVIERQLQGSAINDAGTRTAVILKKILRDSKNERQETRATLASSREIESEPIDLTTDDPEFDFRGFLYRLQQEGTWEDVLTRSHCSACNDIPETRAKLSVPCGHLYCEECLKVLLDNQDSAECVACHGSITASTHLAAMERIANEAESVPRLAPASPAKTKSDAKKKEELDNAWLEQPNVENLSSKVQAVTSQMQQWILKDPAAKIVVFTLFIPMVKLLAKVCSKKGWGFQEYTGKVSADVRTKALQKWKDSKTRHKVLLMSMRAGGLGLNIIEANYVIICDPWWNMVLEDQAFSRVYRIGQQRDCVVLRFVITDAVDTQLMLHLQKLKAQECDRVVDGRNRQDLSVPDLLKLFGQTKRNPETGEVIVQDDEDGLDDFVIAHDRSPIDDSDVEETMGAPARPRD